jgi:hypothetical protein
VTGPARLPRRDDDVPPEWWAPYKAEFPRWRAWRGTRQLWVRLPGTMRVYHADDPAGLSARSGQPTPTRLAIRCGHRERVVTWGGPGSGCLT